MRLCPSSQFPHARLGDCGKIVTGSTPSKANVEFWSGEIPFVTPAQLGFQQPITTAEEYITSDGAKRARLLPEGAVLVCCIGSLGKTGVAGVSLVSNQQINAIVFDQSRVDARYGYYAARSLTPLLEHFAPSTTVKIVKKSAFENMEIPLPPLAEQKRIAGILDAADALRANRRESLAQLDTLLQSVFLDMFGDPVTNPMGLARETLKSVFEFNTGKLDSNAAVEGGQYPFFTCARETFTIDEYAFDCEALLLAGNNATADYSVKHYKGRFNAYQRTYVIKVDEDILTYEYARLALEYLLRDLKRYSKGTNTKYLTMVILNRMPILVPSIEQQRRFAAIVKSVEQQKARQRAHLDELDTLSSSLQSRAFRGEL